MTPPESFRAFSLSRIAAQSGRGTPPAHASNAPLLRLGGPCAGALAQGAPVASAKIKANALQSMLPRSLRMQLLVFLLAAIMLAGAVQGALAYRAALAEADALFDYHMQQTALALRSGLPVDAQGVDQRRPAHF
eukprot:gene30195-37366_t